MNEFLVAYFAGLIVGCFLTHLFFYNKRSGNLIVTSDEDGEYLFVKLYESVDDISGKDKVIFDVTRK